MKNTRKESDSMGEIEVPETSYYGAQTARSLVHFSIGEDKVPLEVVRAFGVLKKAAAMTNHDLGFLDKKKMEFISKAADEVISGSLDDQFPLYVWQTGSGTQSNMNANEVIANKAIELSGGVIGSKDPIHPNDHVNMSQSSNDTFPTAMYIAAATHVKERLLPSLESFADALKRKITEFDGIVKVGRTHLQDATPVTFSQEFSGYYHMMEENISRIKQSLEGLYLLSIGGTAVGTGLNCPEGFAEKVVDRISELTNLPFKSHPNKFSSSSAHDELVFASSALKTCAGSLMKIANDIRWLGSGPRCGIGELILPENEPGSSIMPGKVNPTQCEALTMIAAQVMGNDTAITFGGSQGNFELNVYKPMMIMNFLQSSKIIADGCSNFIKYCLKDLKVDKQKVEEYLSQCLMLVTALSPVIGYDKCAQIAHHAHEKGLSLKEATLSLGFLNESEYEKFVDVTEMTKPGVKK